MKKKREENDSSFKAVPEELLQTDPRVGLTDDEVTKEERDTV